MTQSSPQSLLRTTAIILSAAILGCDAPSGNPANGTAGPTGENVVTLKVPNMT